MKSTLTKIRQNQSFLLFVFLFVYVQSIYTRITIRGVINRHIFDIDGALGIFISVCFLFLIITFFIKRWQKSTTFSTKEMLKILSCSLFFYMMIKITIMYIIALAFGTVEINFGRFENIITLFSTFLDGVIYGGFYLTYYYYRKNKKQQEQLVDYHQALSQSRINQLKTQLNPHFLFNNLNVLDQLIEEDKYKASDFLNQFAEIYRYVLDVSDKKLIAMSEELAFAEKYFNLIKHKYGDAYQMKILGTNVKGKIVPLTLQLLIENAVSHNLGTKEKPVHITIDIGEKLIVSNNLILKQQTKPTSGRALINLKEQYSLLTNDQIEIEKTDHHFTVIIPTINVQEQ